MDIETQSLKIILFGKTQKMIAFGFCVCFEVFVGFILSLLYWALILGHFNTESRLFLFHF